MLYKKFVCLLVLVFLFIPFSASFAMPPGTLLYRTTDNGKMFGYSGHALIDFWNGIATGINPGHVGIYIGEENGRSYVVEALAGGIVKTPLENFVNEAAGEQLIGAKIPKNLSPLQQMKVVDLAKRLASSDLAYDFDFKKQKGPASGEWTCVGLAEKIYESANIPNPFDISYLEYDPKKYAINITPDGFDDYSFYNKEGDCFSKDREFSFIARRQDSILPLPEEKGFNAGLIYRGDRYIFFPYTQFLQDSLRDVIVDKKVSSSFKSSDIRGKTNIVKVLLRWSLINNPVSAVKIAVFEAKEKIASFFPSLNEEEFLAENELLEEEIRLLTESNAQSETPNAAPSKISAAKISVNDNPQQEEDVKKTESSVSAKKSSEDAYVAALASQISKAKEGGEEVEKEKETENKKIKDSEVESLSNTPLNEVRTSSALKPVVISKIYSTDKNDFIELYNPNNKAIDLAEASYRLEKTKTALDPSLIMRIGNSADGTYPGGTIIPAGGYYLIVRDDASSYYLNLAQAIATRSEFDLSGNAQTIYLGIGAISSYEDEDIVDAVGCGSGALYYRGSRPALKIEDYHFLNRIANTNDNRSDFNLLLSSEPAAIEAWRQERILEAAAEKIVEENSNSNQNNNSVIKATSTPVIVATTTNPIATSTNPVATTTNPVATTTNPITTSTPTVSEAVLKAAYKKVLIEKVSASSFNDYISLHNYSDIDIDLSAASFRLEKTKSALDPGILMRLGNLDDGTYPGGTIIPAGESYLIVRDDADSYFLSEADAIASRSDFNLFSSGYALYLARGAVSSPDDEDIIDLLGYGSDASFYDGLAPAPKILEGNYLKRISRTKNNYADFQNFPDDKLISSSTNQQAQDFGIFSPPTPQVSEGISDLWHFDDCFGDYGGVPTVAKFDCGRKIGLNFGALSLDFSQDLSLENFSVSFYFHPNGDSQFAGFVLNGANNRSFSVKYDQGLITVLGIPSSNILFYLDTDLSHTWHQMTVVVSQPDDYYAIYVDGQEVVREFFLAKLPQMSSIDIYDGGHMMLVDEVAVWPRALDADEVKDIFRADRPFYPSVFSLPPQKAAELKYSWSFEEDMGTTTVDSVAGKIIEVPENFWTARAHNNYAINLYYPNLYAKLEEDNYLSDFSLSFWWKNVSYPGYGRSVFYFYDEKGQEMDISFIMQFDNFHRLIFMNDEWQSISQSISDTIPHDANWHHVVGTYDSYRQVFRIFVDGVLKVSRPALRIKEGSEKFNTIKFVPESEMTAIDEFKFYSGTLTDIEVRALYEASKIE